MDRLIYKMKTVLQNENVSIIFVFQTDNIRIHFEI